MGVAPGAHGGRGGPGLPAPPDQGYARLADDPLDHQGVAHHLVLHAPSIREAQPGPDPDAGAGLRRRHDVCGVPGQHPPVLDEAEVGQYWMLAQCFSPRKSKFEIRSSKLETRSWSGLEDRSANFGFRFSIFESGFSLLWQASSL